jgi:hypothetical protein
MARIFSLNLRHAVLVASMLAVIAALLPGAARAADSHATPSTFASLFSAAQGGDTVFMASGSYGSWSGGAKASMVTVAAEPGATPTMSGGNFGSSVRNITIRGVTFTGPVEVAPGSTVMGLVFDGDTWGNVGHAAHEGRLSIVGGGAASGNGVQVKNSTFGPGGCSDGIQDSSNGTQIGPGNEIKGIVQGGCTEHADAIQPYASNNIWIHDNYMHDNEQGIMSPDGVSTGYRITNNVIHTSTGYPCMHLGDTRNGSITHNVCRNGSIRVYGGNQNVASQSMVVQNNANGVDNSACSGCTIDHNQSVTYTGGSGRCAYATASPKGTASDGSDIGLNSCGASPPPPSDTTAPDTTITSGPTGATSDNTPAFAFTASEANSVFECRVDSGSWADCTSPWTTSALSDGAHSASVRATDVAGNTDASPATRSFTVGTAPPPDTTAPDTTIASGPTGTTNDSTPTFAYTASEANSVFECRVDSGSWVNCTSPWTTSALSDGAHSASVRATDVAGNTDASPATRSFTVGTAPPSDTTAPETTIGSGPTNPATSTSASFGFTSSEAGSTFECKLDTGAFAACTSPKAYSALSTGSHTFSVRATDAAGNTDATPAAQTWTINTSPPPPTDHQPVAAYVYSPTTPATGQAVSFDASSATCDDAPCTYSWADDGGDGAAGTQWPLGSGRTMTFTFQGTGVKNVRMAVTDADGDTDSTMKAITVVAPGPPADTTAPNTTITSGPGGTTTNDATPTFAFSSSESGSTFQCQVDSGSWSSCASPWTTSTLSDGAHSVAVRATDAAGNTDASPATQSFTVATATPPPPPTSQNLLGSATVQSAGDAEGAGSAEAFQATASASGSAVSVSIYVDSGSAATTLGAGIYTDVNGHPGTLLTKGTRSSPTSAAWNKVTVPATSLTSGTKYWIALMGTGGTLKYRDGAGSSNCHSESSSSNSLTTLPATWKSGASWDSCPLSGYASS